MRAFKKKVTFVCLAPFDLKKIMRYIDWDNPELFYVDFTFSHNDFLIGSEIYLDYYYPIEEIRRKNACKCPALAHFCLNFNTKTYKLACKDL